MVRCVEVASSLERPSLTRTVDGISRRRVFLAAILVSAISSLIAWFANVEPLRVDTTVTGVRPLDAIIGEIEATSPRLEDVREYRLAIPEGDTFAVTFWLHNVGPFPVTVVSAGEGPEDDPISVVGVRMAGVSAADARPTALPATIPPDGYEEITVRMRVRSCMTADTVSFGSMPVGFRILGLIPRRTSVTMPMTITLLRTPATAC